MTKVDERASPVVSLSTMDAMQNKILTPAQARTSAEDVVRRSGSSFYWAMRRLDEEKRNGMFAVYAYCRIVDDIADDEGDEATKMAELAEWRQEIDRIFSDQQVKHPVAQALAEPIKRFGLRKDDFLALIEGMETDAAETLALADMDALFLYCDQVACAVGRLSNRVFGASEANSDRVAHALGQALQLTNILSDISEDAKRGRLYLPTDLLASHGITETDPVQVVRSPNFAGACAEVADIATRRFVEAQVELSKCDSKIMRPAIMMMHVYRLILEKLKARGWQRIDQQVRLSKLRKLWVAFRYGMF